jgi:hypothetical protein
MITIDELQHLVNVQKRAGCALRRHHPYIKVIERVEMMIECGYIEEEESEFFLSKFLEKEISENQH